MAKMFYNPMSLYSSEYISLLFVGIREILYVFASGSVEDHMKYLHVFVIHGRNLSDLVWDLPFYLFLIRCYFLIRACRIT